MIYAKISPSEKTQMKNRNSPKSLKSPNSPNSRGFSLIELVFAMMFLTIIILGVVSLQTSNLGMLNGQKNQIQAHFLAIQGSQITKGLGYSAISTAFGVCPTGCYIDNSAATYQLKSAPVENVTVGNQVFQRKILIENDANLTSAYKIRSIVEWSDSTGNHNLAESSHIETDLIVF